MRGWMRKALASGTIELPVGVEVFDLHLPATPMRVGKASRAYINAKCQIGMVELLTANAVFVSCNSGFLVIKVPTAQRNGGPGRGPVYDF